MIKEFYMKKLVLLCLAPALLFTACNKTQMKAIKGVGEDNDFRTQVGNYQFNISSYCGASYLRISFAIENESNKAATFKFSNSYLVVEGGRERYQIRFLKEDPRLRVIAEYNTVTVDADSSEVMLAETTELNRALLDGLTVTFHTEINGRYSFTISNMCADLR